MRDELMRVHRTLCSPFVDEDLFRSALGGGRGDIGTVGRYLGMPLLKRPALSLFFDREFYAATNPETLERQQDGLLHFIDQGFAKLRSPHPLVDLQYILAEDEFCLGDPPVIASLMDTLDYDLVKPSPYFDLAWYAQELGAEAPAQGLLRHFLTVGLAAGRQPNKWLDPDWYAQRNADAPRERYGALRHFLVVGDPEARHPSAAFDGKLYLRRYIDVADAGMPPLRHYLANGRHEGRQVPSERPAHPPMEAARPGLGVEVAGAFPVEAEATQRAFTGMRALLAEAQQQRKDSVRVRRPPVIVSSAPLDDLDAIVLPPATAPRLSILVPAFN